MQKYFQRIQLLHQKETKGPAAARNMGFRSSKADIFICLDSDIVCAKDFLRTMIQALEMNPDWVAAEATVLPRDGVSSILSDAPENRGRTFPSGASAYRAEALKSVGGFDEAFKLPACEDADLAGRVMELGKYGYASQAVVYHPVRRVSLRTHWRWRRHWKYEMFLAKRHGFLSFPGKATGPFPRLRVTLAAVVTLPGGRFIEGIKYISYKPRDGLLACLYGLFDVFCGLWAVPSILFSRVPPPRNYLSDSKKDKRQ
jgi:GT2 family glycosyltransferase